MKLAGLASFALCAAFARPLSAAVVGPLSGPVAVPSASARQDAPAVQPLALRVTAIGQGRLAMVDRGATDGLAVGDVVRFFPRGGGTYRGLVTRVEDRSAAVEIQHPAWLPELGTKGGAQIPVERLQALRAARRETPPPGGAEAVPAPGARATDTPPVSPDAVPDAAADGAAEDPAAAADGAPQDGAQPHDPWNNRDDGWESGMPLLAEVGAVRPEERAPLLTGRVYVIADHVSASQDSRSDTFLRAGTEILLENPFGRGGGLQFDGEVNYRATDVEDQVDESESHLRIDRLSYYRGGTRFAPERWEVGRFLQDGLPEFGVIDGYEYAQRLASGDRVGASIGFMPEPDEDYGSGEDLQIAGWYRWNADDSERLSATAGYQKSFHDGDADRDLLLAKFAYLPPTGWTVDGTAWIDVYTSGDDLRGPGLGLTQLWLGARRSWADGSGLSTTLTHVAFPDIERDEFVAPIDTELEDDRNDRLACAGWTLIDQDLRLDGEIGVWNDEDETGVDLEVGSDLADLFVHGDSAGVVVFGADGSFSSVIGGRLSYRGRIGRGDGSDGASTTWDVSYEIANHDQAGFLDENDDVMMNWLHLGWDRFSATGWSTSVYADGHFWDEENSLAVGIYLTRSF